MSRIFLVVVILGLFFSGFIYAQDVPKDGPYQEYYADGTTIKLEGYYQDGKKHGLFKEYDEACRLMRESTFKQGKEDGLTKIYDEESGRLASEWYYRDGEHVGVAKQYDSDGRVISEWDYSQFKPDNITIYRVLYDNGVPASIDTFKDGLLIDKKYYSKEGELVFESEY